MRLRKVTGRIPTREELKGAFIVRNHTMTGDPGLLHFMLADNARVVHKKNVGSFDIITRHKIQVGDDKAEVRETILQGIKNDPTPIIIYPEGATTNGQVGLLRYAAFIFGLNRPVHPVGLRCVVRIKAYYRARGCHAERKRRSLARRGALCRYYPAFSFIPMHTLQPLYSFNMFIVAFQPWINVDAWMLPAVGTGNTAHAGWAARTHACAQPVSIRAALCTANAQRGRASRKVCRAHPARDGAGDRPDADQVHGHGQGDAAQDLLPYARQVRCRWA